MVVPKAHPKRRCKTNYIITGRCLTGYFFVGYLARAQTVIADVDELLAALQFVAHERRSLLFL